MTADQEIIPDILDDTFLTQPWDPSMPTAVAPSPMSDLHCAILEYDAVQRELPVLRELLSTLDPLIDTWHMDAQWISCLYQERCGDVSASISNHRALERCDFRHRAMAPFAEWHKGLAERAARLGRRAAELQAMLEDGCTRKQNEKTPVSAANAVSNRRLSA